MTEYAFTTVAVVHRPTPGAIALHNSSYRLRYLPRIGDRFRDSGRGDAVVFDVVLDAQSGGLYTVVLS